MNEPVKLQCMDYGRALMTRVAGGSPMVEPKWARDCLAALSGNSDELQLSEPLRSVVTLVPDGVGPLCIRPVHVGSDTDGEGEWLLNPVPREEAMMDRHSLYHEFRAADRGTKETFERFFYLMRKYAATLPNTYGEPGVSLFEQWKFVTSLAVISGDVNHVPQQLGLVGGDIPGIQRTIGMVTSKGAAKAMRGRSAFIQLLGVAVVRRVLDELELCEANVVYDAGGNFVILTGWDANAGSLIAQIEDSTNEVLLAGTKGAQRLFHGFGGDLAVALAGCPIDPRAYGAGSALEVLSGRVAPVSAGNSNQSMWQKMEKALKDRVAEAKHRSFAGLALASEEGWNTLFAPEPAHTSVYCAVCQRQPVQGEQFFSLSDDTSDFQCRECKGFNELANALGHGAAHLVITAQPPETPSAWQTALHAVSGAWYAIGGAHDSEETVLALNADNFPSLGVTGFRPLCTTTPTHPDGSVRDNEELAGESKGALKRLGVLRMDVDDLAWLMVGGLPRRSVLLTAELSRTLETFFSGRIGDICQKVDGGKHWFYVLFAGGDDLFVLGPWTAMPKLALAICDEFAAFTGKHPRIHLSGGIALVDGKAPMHSASLEAIDALEAAKHLDENEKEAITFLGETLPWAEFRESQAFKDQLVEIVDPSGPVRFPRSLLTTLLTIAQRYQTDGGSRTAGAKASKGPPKMVYGPWMWRQAYAIARMAQGRDDPAALNTLKRLSKSLVEGRIGLLGLSARWAQWETRKEK